MAPPHGAIGMSAVCDIHLLLHKSTRKCPGKCVSNENVLIALKQEVKRVFEFTSV